MKQPQVQHFMQEIVFELPMAAMASALDSREDVMDRFAAINSWETPFLQFTPAAEPAPVIRAAPPEPVPLGDLIEGLQSATADRAREFVR